MNDVLNLYERSLIAEMGFYRASSACRYVASNWNKSGVVFLVGESLYIKKLDLIFNSMGVPHRLFKNEDDITNRDVFETPSAVIFDYDMSWSDKTKSFLQWLCGSFANVMVVAFTSAYSVFRNGNFNFPNLTLVDRGVKGIDECLDLIGKPISV